MADGSYSDSCTTATQQHVDHLVDRGATIIMMVGRTWSTPAHNLRSVEVVPRRPPPAPGPQTSSARWRPLGPPQAGRTLAPPSLRRQGDDLCTTAPTASGQHADRLGALKARAPSRASTQGSRSRRVLLILERRIRGCDELRVARREMPKRSSGAQQKAPAPVHNLRCSGVRPLPPPRWASRTARRAPRGRLPARPPAGAAPAAGAAAAPRLR